MPDAIITAISSTPNITTWPLIDWIVYIGIVASSLAAILKGLPWVGRGIRKGFRAMLTTVRAAKELKEQLFPEDGETIRDIAMDARDLARDARDTAREALVVSRDSNQTATAALQVATEALGAVRVIIGARDGDGRTGASTDGNDDRADGYGGRSRIIDLKSRGPYVPAPPH